MAIDAYIQKNYLDVEVRFDIISYLVENEMDPRTHWKCFLTILKIML